MLKYKIVHDEPDVKGIIYMFEEETLHYDSCFTYVSLEVDDWNRELSPWPFSAGKMVFSGEGPETLKELLKIIKEVEKERSFEKRYILTFILMGLSAAVMGIVVFFLNRFLENVIFVSESTLSIWLRLMICISAALCVYLFLIVVLGVVRKRDAAYIPFISKFDRFLWS